ncbi:MAG: hypothetical protein HOQ17_11955 [Gemmatimonadaceae bacterium]|nr:hypothetical protein [Gemmatimonadaceae bacterium]NUO95478.1 hypothetical protein [Gemmatimonadaceae bacterium]NUP55344.1 hypothetical protein [Gemmatimonadaceae bacterium]NUS33767.1 hypothetical protein [Gemmatimonadaceae bacterium]
MSLQDLTVQLRRWTTGEIGLLELQDWLTPILSADSLDVEESDAQPWEHAAEDTRLFWRIIYLFEAGGDEPSLRLDAERIVACLDSTGDASATYELLPLVLDQDRLTTILTKHLAGTISRTGFLGVVAESGYPPHAKLWLTHAPGPALDRLADRLACSAYQEVAALLEKAPE